MIFRSLENAGVLPSHDARAAKPIRLANRLTLSHLLIAWPCFLAFKLNGWEIPAWALLPLIAGSAMTFLLNGKGWTTAARINLAVNISVTFAICSVALGRGSGVHMLLVAAGLNFLLLFDWEREKGFLLAGIAVNSALFLGIQTLDFRLVPLYAMNPAAEPSLRLAVSVTALFLFFSSILHLVIQNARVERDLIADRNKAQAGCRIKTRLLGNMSHEIRNPLNVIMGSAQLMEKSGSEPNLGEFLANIKTAAKDLLAILNDALDLTKIEAGKMQLDSKPIHVGELVDKVLAPFLSQAARKGLNLRLDADRKDRGMLRGDPVRLTQILEALLAMALKSTGEGTIVLRISRAGGDLVRPTLRIEVSYPGAGIPEEELLDLFQPFRQANENRPSTFGRCGLGLLLCKGLVELMGGSINLSSTQGVGTTVDCAIPFEEMNEAESSSPEPDTREPRPSMDIAEGGQSGAEGILVVEDHPVNRMLLQSMLHVQGFRADEASDGQQALEALKARSYGLILMDCHMPVMDGMECTRRIRAMDGPRPIIIGITADTLPETRRNCLRAGMDQVLLKPLQEQELRKVLRPWKPTESPEAPIPATPVVSEWLDIERLNHLIQSTRLSDPGHRKKALEQFESDVQALRQALGESLDQEKARQLKEFAHGLKGFCLTLGLGRLAEICKRIEGITGALDSPDWSPVKADFETVCEASLAELRRALER